MGLLADQGPLPMGLLADQGPLRTGFIADQGPLPPGLLAAQGFRRKDLPQIATILLQGQGEF